jgi:hypothetical protein
MARAAVSRLTGVSMQQHLTFMQVTASCVAARGAEAGAQFLCRAGEWTLAQAVARLQAQQECLLALPPDVSKHILDLGGFLSGREMVLKRARRLLGRVSSWSRGNELGPVAAQVDELCSDNASSVLEFVSNQRAPVCALRAEAAASPAAARVLRRLQASVELVCLLDASCGHMARQWASIAQALARVGHSSPPELTRAIEGSTLVSYFSLADLASQAAESASLFCIEKHGASPRVVVRTSTPGGQLLERTQSADLRSSVKHSPTDDAAVVSLGHFEYCLVEVLKNSFGAHVKRYGSLHVEDDASPAVYIDVSANAKSAGWRVTDAGGGCPDPRHVTELFSSATPPPAGDDDWKYSRHFGAAMSGYGMGLKRASWYLRMMGGAPIALMSLPGAGCVASSSFPRHGEVPDTVALMETAACIEVNE